jgi:hypothetical protein
MESIFHVYMEHSLLSFQQGRGGGFKKPVEIAEQIVNNLMPLLDVLHDVAAGTELAPGTSQRNIIEEAIRTLPLQLK